MTPTDSSNPDPTGIGARLDEHFIAKVKEAEAKFGRTRGKYIATVASATLKYFGQIDARRTEVQFFQDWINEVSDILEPDSKPRIILPDA